MSHVRVRIHFAAPAERVFDAVSDHERFLHDRMTTTKVITAGKPDRNGLGCRRQVTLRAGTPLVEEITAWDPPRSFDYLIVEGSRAVVHEGGRLTFTPAGSGTDVEWTTRFRVTVPLLGPVLARLIEAIFRAAFTKLLKAAKSKLEA